MNVKSDSFVSFIDGKPEVTTIERLTDTASQPLQSLTKQTPKL